MSADVYNMERKELCHERHMVSLLTDHLLSPGLGDCTSAHHAQYCKLVTSNVSDAIKINNKSCQ